MLDLMAFLLHFSIFLVLWQKVPNDKLLISSPGLVFCDKRKRVWLVVTAENSCKRSPKKEMESLL
jgi:hypothetical protein